MWLAFAKLSSPCSRRASTPASLTPICRPPGWERCCPVSARRSSGVKRRTSKRTTRTARRRRGAPSKAGDPSRIAAELVHKILAHEGVAHAEVGLAHGNDGVLRVLNKKYRGMDKATDILSFTYEDVKDEEGHRVLFGDLVVSVPRVLAQA